MPANSTFSSSITNLFKIVRFDEGEHAHAGATKKPKGHKDFKGMLNLQYDLPHFREMNLHAH